MSAYERKKTPMKVERETTEEQDRGPLRHFHFGGVNLAPTIAHNGVGEVLSRRVLEADATACNFIDLTVVPPGCSIGTHTHGRDTEEIYAVISGRGRMLVDGDQFEVGPGHVVLNRPEGTHGLTNIGDEPIELVVLEIPVSSGASAQAVQGWKSGGWEAEPGRVLCKTPYFDVRHQRVQLPDGSGTDYYTLEFAGPAVGVIARRGSDVLLIHQYRFIVDEYVWAIPSGGVSKGETLERAALRELQEETGFTARSLEPVLRYYPSYGSGNQEFVIFLANDVVETSGCFDRNEVIDVRWFPRAEVVRMLLANEIVDGLSVTPLATLLLREEVGKAAGA